MATGDAPAPPARDAAEEIRVRYRYRRLILDRAARVSLDVARRLVGPDCAYHLYRSFGANQPLTDDCSESGNACGDRQGGSNGRGVGTSRE